MLFSMIVWGESVAADCSHEVESTDVVYGVAPLLSVAS